MVSLCPIKDMEIKQILKLAVSYKKNDKEYFDKILKENNVNELKRKLIIDSIEKCYENRKSEVFEYNYGLCIAECQKIYRGFYRMQNKSLTGLISTFPALKKYTTPINDVLKLNTDKYKFNNKLINRTNAASGVFMSADNVEKLYYDYYDSVYIKSYIDNYFSNVGDESSEKFMSILSECMNNKCGLLEAIMSLQKAEIITNQNENISKNLNAIPQNANVNINETSANNNSSNTTTANKVTKSGKKIISCRLLILLVGIIEGVAIRVIKTIFSVFLYIAIIGKNYYLAITQLSNDMLSALDYDVIAETTNRTFRTQLIAYIILFAVIGILIYLINRFFFDKMKDSYAISSKAYNKFYSNYKVILLLFISLCSIIIVFTGFGTMASIESKVSKVCIEYENLISLNDEIDMSEDYSYKMITKDGKLTSDELHKELKTNLIKNKLIIKEFIYICDMCLGIFDAQLIKKKMKLFIEE